MKKLNILSKWSMLAPGVQEALVDGITGIVASLDMFRIFVGISVTASQRMADLTKDPKFGSLLL